MTRPTLEPPLDRDHLAALRAARARLVDAAQQEHATLIEIALLDYVRVMCDADFGRYTIRALVEAALHVGLPFVRGKGERARRAQTLAAWIASADDLAVTLGAGSMASA